MKHMLFHANACVSYAGANYEQRTTSKSNEDFVQNLHNSVLDVMIPLYQRESLRMPTNSTDNT